MSIPSWFTKRLSESARSASGCVSFSGLTGSRNGPITSSAMKARSIERETLMRKGMASSSTTPSLRELLLAAELWLAFFQEGGGAFLHVFRGGGKAEQVRFHLQSFFEARAEPPHDCFLGEAQGHGRVGDHLPPDLKGMASSSTTPSLRELLLAAELWLAFFQEGGGAFLHVFRGGGKAEQVRFHLQSFFEARAEPPHDCFLGEAQGHGRVGDHLP